MPSTSRPGKLLDRLGYDGVGFNEHHCSPYGLMNSPNLMAAAAAQRTKRLKLLIYGNLLPLHEPLRLAEELAMLDCLSNGRLISGFARGIPREYQVHNVPLAESRARFEEAYEIITRAWTEDVFSYRGQILVATRTSRCGRARCSSRIRRSGRRSPAARNRSSSPPGTTSRSRRAEAAHAGCRTTSSAITPMPRAQPATASRPIICRIGARRLCRRQQGAGGAGGRTLFPLFQPLRCSATATSPRPHCSARPAMSATPRSTTCARRTCTRPARLREDFRNMTMADVEQRAETMPWGTADEVAERIIEAADRTGAGTVQCA